MNGTRCIFIDVNIYSHVLVGKNDKATCIRFFYNLTIWDRGLMCLVN